MKIIKADEPILVNTIKVLFYGEPGAGKTSLASSTEKSLCLDFDKGVHRSSFRKDSAVIESWDEVAIIKPAKVTGYKTLIVDTVGRQLDMIAAHLIRNNGKLATRAGNLTLQGYGELKAVFAQWVKMVEQLGLDLIFIAHNKEEKDGDNMIMRPDIQGSSYSEVFKVADAVGYIRIINRKRTVDFEPTERHVGKDTAKIGLVEIENLHDSPNFGGELISRIKDSINSASESGRIATNIIEEYRQKLEECNNLNCLDDIRKLISTIDNNVAQSKAKELLLCKMHAMEAVWSKEKECFVSVKTDNKLSEEPLRSLEWWIDQADSITSGLFEWWQSEEEKAKKDLNDEDFKKLSSYISQLLDIESSNNDENQQNNDNQDIIPSIGQWSPAAQNIIDQVDKLATAEEVDKFRASKRKMILGLGDESADVFGYIETAYQGLKEA